MRLTWIIVSVLIFSIFGIQNSLAEKNGLDIPSLEKYKGEISFKERINEVIHSDITDGLNHLIQTDRFKLVQSSNNEFLELEYPSWIQTIALWWIEDKISDDDLLQILGFVIENELIYDTSSKSKIWMEFTPQQCQDYPPEIDWMKNIDYNTSSKIKSHYKKLDIRVYDVKYQSSLDSVLRDCSAPYSGTWYLQVNSFDMIRMQELGFTLVGRYSPDKIWDKISVHTDKSFYNLGDTITVYIKNKSNNSISFSGGNIGIRISDFKGEPLFPCVVQTSYVPELKPGDYYSRTYDVKNSCQKEHLRSGVYSVYSEFFTVEDNKTQNYRKTDLVNIQFPTEKPTVMTISEIIDNHDKLDLKLITTEGVLSLNELNEPIGFYDGPCSDHVPSINQNYVVDYRPTYVLSNDSDGSIAIEVLPHNTNLDFFNLTNEKVDVTLTGTIHTTELKTDLCSDVKNPSVFIRIDYEKDQKIIDLSEYRLPPVFPHAENEK